MASRIPRSHLSPNLLAILLILFFTGCSAPPPSTPAETPTIPGPSATPTQEEPSPTPIPMAAIVNGEGIPQAEFEAELVRYQAVQQQSGQAQTVEEQRQVVLQDMIDQVLLAQGAAEGGYEVTEAVLQARIDLLAGQIGGADALAKWQSDHGYQPEEFRSALRRSIAAAWQRDQIVAGVPDTAEQVHVRQILVNTRQDAEYALGRLVPGLDFATLAFKYNTITGGDLGWFPRGYLDDPAVETAAFNLEVGQLSEIIEGKVGFHILQLIEKDPAHPLSPDARQVLEKKALHDWLQAHRQQSQTQIITP